MRSRILAILLALLPSKAIHTSEPSLPIEEMACLTEAIYFEARGESTAGQVAVANVIRNRVNEDRWPDTYCGVVHQNAQFSYYWDDIPEKFSSPQAKAKAANISINIIVGNLSDNTSGATNFHTIDIPNPWNLTKLKTIGRHIFYK